MTETPKYGLTIFKVHFGVLTLKGYTKGEHVLRFEAVCHNTKALGAGRVLDRFPDIVARLAGMLERFCTTLDCVDVGFIPDGILDQLPQPSVIGKTRVGGIDLDKARTRTALAGVAALAAAPDGFSVADLANKVNAISPGPVTPSVKPPTTSASSGATTLSPNRGAAAATTSRPKRPAPSPGCSCSANKSSAQYSPASEAHDVGANLPTGQPSTATTRPSALTCKTSSTTSQSPPGPHRQQFVDQRRQAPREIHIVALVTWALAEFVAELEQGMAPALQLTLGHFHLSSALYSTVRLTGCGRPPNPTTAPKAQRRIRALSGHQPSHFTLCFFRVPRPNGLGQAQKDQLSWAM